MRHKWEVHGRDGSIQELYIKFDAGWRSEWRIVGWIQACSYPSAGYLVYCHWIGTTPDYPETKIFETDKKARRALKAAATIAIVGGYRGAEL